MARTLALFSGISVVATALVILLLPSSAIAAAGLVPCEGTGCGTCELVVLTNNVIEYVIILMIVGVALVFSYAGFVVLTSGGDTAKMEQAKRMFSSVFVGLIISMSAWLIIDTALKILLANTGQVQFSADLVGPWNEIPSGVCTSQDPLSQTDELTALDNGWEGITVDYTQIFNQGTFEYTYRAFIKEPNNNCLYEIAGGDFSVADCIQRYQVSVSGYEQYTVEFCDGSTGTPPPSLSALPFCSGGVVGSTGAYGIPGGTTNGVVNNPSAVQGGYCGISQMSCFGGQAANASCVCRVESSGNPNVVSGTDRCLDGNAYSFGLWQINIFAHYNRIPGCSGGFFAGNDVTKAGCGEWRTNSNGLRYCARSKCHIINPTVYNTCKQSVINPATNIGIACQLFDGDFGAWRNSARICGAPY